MLASAPNSRPSLLPLPAALLTAELGPVVMADDPCEAAFGGADPTGPRKYYRARYYDPKIGRFISEDPIRFDGGLNLYAYVDNNPVNFFDPTGWKKKRRRFKTPDAAAMAALKLCYGETQFTNWEFCGTLCLEPDRMFSFTPPTTQQDSGTCKPDACPPKTERAGQYHTHPPASAGGDEDFSFRDKWNVLNDPQGMPSYLGQPSGGVIRYDKDCRCSTKVPGTLK